MSLVGKSGGVLNSASAGTVPIYQLSDSARQGTPRDNGSGAKRWRRRVVVAMSRNPFFKWVIGHLHSRQTVSVVARH